MSVKFAQQDEQIIIEEVEDNNELSKEEENRFNKLCDGVTNCLALVQNSHFELMEFKSLLLQENVAPSLLVKLSLITGLVFRSVSDLHHPLGELIRLVKVYSEPWEKKSQSLRKLHKGYEIKAGQLNIALKRLAIQNEEARRVRKKEVLQNWELLFSRAQMSRNHGRRWKYRMFDFKLKASQGIEHLHDYFQELLDLDDGIKQKVQTESVEQPVRRSGRKSQISDSLKFQDDMTVRDIVDGDVDEEYQESFEEKEEEESVEPIETADASVGTSDANYTQTLVLRIYNPRGLEMFDNLRCEVVYGDKIYETGYLDKSSDLQEEENRLEMEAAENLDVSAPESSKAKKGLMGRRKNKQKDQTKSVEQIRKEQAEKRLRYLNRNEEVRVPVPVEVTSGINKDSLYQSVKFIVFVDGKNQNKICQATIDLEELQAMEIGTFKETVYQGDLVTPPSTPNAKPFSNLEPMPYPVYEYQDPIDSNESPAPMGQMPIACFWSRREDQVVFHRSVETAPIARLVEELTGINLDLVTKDELTREKIDECISPRPVTPVPPTVLKSEFDSAISRFQDLILEMREKHEQQLQDLMAAKETVKAESSRPTSVYHKDCASSPIFPYQSSPGTRRPTKNDSRQARVDYFEKPKSSKSRDTLSTSGPDDQEEVIYLSSESRMEKEEKYSKIDDNRLPKWGENISEGFLERLSIYSELSSQHRDELAKKVKLEVSKAIEEKLTDLYKLHDDLTEEDVAVALADMCFPAVFMPVSNSSGTVYNPRAHQYFHPMSLRNLRLSQPPSIFKLPPIKQNQMSILNLFDIGNDIQIRRIDKNNSTNTAMKKIQKRASENIMPQESTTVAQELN